MYLIRRRSDGKFFKNKDYHSANSFGVDGIQSAHNWTTHPATECHPFRTEAGARNSRLSVYVKCDPACKWISSDGRRRSGYKHTVTCKKATKAAFDALYAIEDVELKPT